MIDGTSSFAEEYNLQTLIENYNKRNGEYILNECVWLFCGVVCCCCCFGGRGGTVFEPMLMHTLFVSGMLK